MQILITIECDPAAELVARTLYAYNYYPGRKPNDAPWPPKLRQQLSHYLRLGEAVIRAQRELLEVTTISASGTDITIACNDHDAKDAILNALTGEAPTTVTNGDNQ